MERVKRVSISAFAFNFTTARFSALFSHVLTPCNLSRLSLSLFLHFRNGSLSPCFERSVTAPPPRLLHLGPSFARQTLRNNGQSYVRQRLLPRFRRFLNAFLPRLSFSIFFFSLRNINRNDVFKNLERVSQSRDILFGAAFKIRRPCFLRNLFSQEIWGNIVYPERKIYLDLSNTNFLFLEKSLGNKLSKQ